MALKEKLIDKAQKLVQKGYLDKAIAEYRAASDADPRDISVRLRIGDLYVKLGRKPEAVKEYIEAARANAQRGFYLKAIAVYKQVLKLEENLEIHSKLAELYVKQRLIADAIGEYSYLVAWFERRGKTNEVLELLKKMVDIDPENIGVRLKLAELFQKLSFDRDALSEYSLIFDKLVSAGKLDTAEKVFLQLYNTNPAEERVLSGLAELYRLKRDDKERLRFLKGLFNYYSDSAMTDDARRVAADILEIKPDDPHASRLLKKSGKPAHEEPRAPEPPEAEPFKEEASAPSALISWPEEEIEITIEGFEEEAASETAAPREEARETTGYAVEQALVDEVVEGAGADEAAEAAGTVAAGDADEIEIDMDALMKGELPSIDAGVEEAISRVSAELLEGVELAGEAEPSAEVEEAPVEAEEAPVEVAETPVEAAETPVEAAETPVKAEETPVEATETPVEATEAPVEATEAPVKAAETPVKAAETPVEAAEIPVEVEEAPPEVEEAPPEVEEAPEVLVEAPIDEMIEVQERAEVISESVGAAEEALDVMEEATGDEPGPVEEAEAVVADLLEEAPREAEPSTETVEAATGPVLVEVEAGPALEEAVTEPIEPEAPAAVAEDEPEAAVAAVEEDELQEDLSSAIEELMEKMEPAEAVEAAAPPPVPDAPAPAEQYVDLSVELGMEEASSNIAGAWGSQESAETFDEFKTGIGKQLSKEDSETHYNLGIAYMEMELYSEASKEFKIALKDSRLEIDCYTRLGLCAMAEGNPQEAVVYYSKGLRAASSEEEKKGMMYELALAHEAQGQRDAAFDLFSAIFSMDPDFREVAVKLTGGAPEELSVPLNDDIIEVELL